MTLITRLAREAAPCQGADYGETCEAEKCLPCHVCAVRPAIEAKMRELVEACAFTPFEELRQDALDPTVDMTRWNRLSHGAIWMKDAILNLLTDEEPKS